MFSNKLNLPLLLFSMILILFVVVPGCNSGYEVTLEAKPEGAGEVKGEGTYEKEEQVEISAEANPG